MAGWSFIHGTIIQPSTTRQKRRKASACGVFVEKTLSEIPALNNQ
jgi:hypothetical protein